MRRRRSTRSVIKLLAAAAVATASIVGLVRLSTPPARGELPLCEDIEEIDTNVLIKPPKQGNAPEQLMDFLRTYKNEHRPGDDDDDDDEKEPGAVAAGLDTYAGEWYSRDAGGTFVLAFTDDPKPHLEAIRRRRPPETGDWPVDVVRAPHTESEVKAAQKKVSKMFKQLRGRPNLKSYGGSGINPQRSRVEICMSGYTFEDMAAMADALDDDAHGKVCLWGRPQIRVPTLEDRLKARFAPMADAGADPLVVCLGRSRPMSKFFGEPDVSAGSCGTLHVRLSPPRCPRLEALPRDSPECPDELDLPNCDMLPNPKVGDFCEGDGECGTDKAENNCRNEVHSSADIYKIISLEESDADHQQAAGPAEGWRTIKCDDKRATFYWTDGNKYKVCSYEKTRAGWDLAMNSCGGGSGKCGREGLRLALPKGRFRTVEMRLDRRHPPDPDSTTLHLLVRQNGCGSGRSGVERMPKPEVIESATEIRIAMGVIPPTGAQNCLGHGFDPITIELAAPIGRRKIVDGLVLPPEPLKGLPRLRPHRRDAGTSPGLPLALCEDIKEIDPKIDPKPPKRGRPPKPFMDHLLWYARSEHPDTYAGRWISGGTVVLAFTDDPKHHRRWMLRTAKHDGDGWRVDAVQTAHSEFELTVAEQRVSSMIHQFLARSGDSTLEVYSRANLRRSRVEIDFRALGHPTVEDLTAMADALDDEFHGMVCVNGPLWDSSIRPPTVGDRFAPMADAGADPLVACGRGSYPVLRAPLSKLPELRTRAGLPADCGWELRLALPKFLGTVQMRLDPQNLPDSDSTTLRLLVSQNGCASGRSGVERMPKPEVIESATEIRIAMGVIEGGGGRWQPLCRSNSYAPITIKLAAPIGQRKIVDGLFLPPRPLLPKSLRIPRRPYRRIPRRPYRRNLVIYALWCKVAVLAMAMAAMAVRRWRRANAEVRRWRRAPRDHAS